MFKMMCSPALMFFLFSITEIIIDLYRGLLNTATVKSIVTVVITFLLDTLCKRGYKLVSWLIVFIPFILMTVIITYILLFLGLNPGTGKIKHNKSNHHKAKHHNNHPEKHHNHHQEKHHNHHHNVPSCRDFQTKLHELNQKEQQIKQCIKQNKKGCLSDINFNINLANNPKCNKLKRKLNSKINELHKLEKCINNCKNDKDCEYYCL
tara:strand:+ start:350 stop:970 length:621 start_codon:yes stop_codon:yes gene_type:complete